jgi:hypothetical protein
MRMILAALMLLLCVSCAAKTEPRQITMEEAITIARQAAVAEGYSMPEGQKIQTASTLSSSAHQPYWAVGLKLPAEGVHVEVWVDAHSKEIRKLNATKLQEE